MGERLSPGLTSIHRKCLSYNSIQQKSLSYNSIHQVHGENACHTNFMHFRKKLNNFCGFLRTVEQTGDKKKLFKFFFEKIAYHTISIYDTQIFQVILKICPKICFCFFFQAQIEFCKTNKHFPKKKILHAKFNFLCA